MLIHFEKLGDISIANLNNGNGEGISKMFLDDQNRIMISRLPKALRSARTPIHRAAISIMF